MLLYYFIKYYIYSFLQVPGPLQAMKKLGLLGSTTITHHKLSHFFGGFLLHIFSSLLLHVPPTCRRTAWSKMRRSLLRMSRGVVSGYPGDVTNGAALPACALREELKLGRAS